MAVSDKIISIESGGDPDAKNPNSSATGLGQFVSGTWLDTIKAARPDLAQGKSDDELLALRNDPQLSREMTDAYAASNGRILSGAGLPVTPGSVYLAHFAGPRGAVGLLNADPSAPAASILGQGFAKANPTLAGYTAGELAAWADRKMGSGGSAPMSMAGPPAAPQSAPTAPAPSQAPAGYTASAPAAAPFSPAPNLAALTAVPQLQNLLPGRPNPFGIRLPTAPFSLRG